MRSIPLLTLGLAITLLLLPRPTQAQDASQPEARFAVILTIQVPYGEENQAVSWWIDNWLSPQWNLNPNILTVRVGGHLYGINGGQIMRYVEYADMSHLTPPAPCQVCAEWRNANRPEEGTAEWEEWDANRRTYLKYNSVHHDEIFALNMNWAKN